MRIPLHIKLMVSYLLVVGLVFLPTFFYVRTIQKRDVRDGVLAELREEAIRLADRLAATPPHRFDDDVRTLLGVLPQRITVIDVTGRVLADSSPLPNDTENHAERPEVREALASEDGVGQSARASASSREEHLYAAVRFPRTGEARGVVRVSVPSVQLREIQQKSTSFLTNASALALTVAVFLSLVAAIVVSRPLRRIADGARTLASGDFGHSIDVSSDDELGEAAAALNELASQLRDKLVQSGADRATLRGLVDDLPVGVVLFDPKGTPVIINGRARDLAQLSPASEYDRARQIAELPDQAAVLAEVLREGFTKDAPLVLPWSPATRLVARWIALSSPQGERQSAVVISDDVQQADRLGRATDALEKAAEQLRAASRRGDVDGLALELSRAADACDGAAVLPFPRPAEVHSVRLGDVVQRAREDVRPEANLAGVRVEVLVPDADQRVTEAGHRVERALRALFACAIREAERGETVKVRSETREARVRLSVRTHVAPAQMPLITQAVQVLGGDAGWQRDGEDVEAWVLLARA